jgi:hypothetical protein
MTDTPNPGSDEAITQGCTCPVLDNGHGCGRVDANGQPMFWINFKCPLHGPQYAKEQQP